MGEGVRYTFTILYSLELIGNAPKHVFIVASLVPIKCQVYRY